MRMREEAILGGLLLDEPGDGGAGGGASGAAGASGSGAGASGSAGGASGTSAQPKFEDDPRFKGAISDLQKERKARQEFERKIATYEATIAERQKQIEALAGVKPVSQKDADLQVVRDRMIEMFPALANLSEEQLAKLEELGKTSQQFAAAEERHWTTHSKNMLAGAHKSIAEEVGELSERQKQRINALYYQEAERDPKFLARHNAGDPELVKEFVKNYLADFVEPVKRKATAAEAGRFRPVPGGRERSTPLGPGEKPIDLKDDKAVMDYIVASRKGQFGRR
jgi:hypothetical protein